MHTEMNLRNSKLPSQVVFQKTSNIQLLLKSKATQALNERRKLNGKGLSQIPKEIEGNAMDAV